MAKHKKRPVIPIYAIAVVWIIFTLVHRCTGCLTM